MNSEEGRRQLAKIKELHLLADRLGCTAAQLAIGTNKANDTWAVTVILLQSQKITTMFTETSLLQFGSSSLQYTGPEVPNVPKLSTFLLAFCPVFLQPGVCAARESAQYFWEFLTRSSSLRTWAPSG